MNIQYSQPQLWIIAIGCYLVLNTAVTIISCQTYERIYLKLPIGNFWKSINKYKLIYLCCIFFPIALFVGIKRSWKYIIKPKWLTFGGILINLIGFILWAIMRCWLTDITVSIGLLLIMTYKTWQYDEIEYSIFNIVKIGLFNQKR